MTRVIIWAWHVYI